MSFEYVFVKVKVSFEVDVVEIVAVISRSAALIAVLKSERSEPVNATLMSAVLSPDVTVKL